MPHSRVWLGLLGLLAAVSCVQGLVVGIDLGSQWFKLAMVRPGRPIDIVLNEQSARKTHTMVGWNRDERVFGSDAFNLQARYPAQNYGYLTSLLGKSVDHPIFKDTKEWITFGVEEDPQRNSFLIKHDANTTYQPEELVAMILRSAKELASTSFGSPVKDCVITVPPFLTQHERQAITDAASIAGWNVLSLINDVTAFALIYARDRFENQTQNVIFYDIGATSAKAVLATFQSVPDIKSTKNKTIVQVLVRSTAWDQTLGGRFIDRNLANHFKKVILSKYPSFNVEEPRLTLRLIREAQRLKEVLSANQLAQVTLVGLGDYDDLVVTVTRKELEEMNQGIAARAVSPIQALLDEANITKEEITFFELVGGGSRVPLIQNALKAFMGREDLDRHVNGDEGAALGAAFFAAGMSSTFKSSKEIRLRDITYYPVNVKINLDQAGSDNDVIIEENEGEDKSNTVLLVRGNKLNTRKALTFYSYSNFSLDLSYSQPELLPTGAKTEIAHIVVSGMPYAGKYNTTGKPKVHASFKLSSNGTVSLDHADVEITVLEKPKPKPAPVPKPEKTEEKKTDDKKTDDTKPEEEKKAEEGKPEEEKKATEDSKPEEEKKEEEEKEKKGEEEQASDEAKADDDEEEPATTEEPELVKKTLKLPLKIVSVESRGVKGLEREQRQKSEMKLTALDVQDKLRRELQKEKNGLEAYIYETRDKLENEEIIEASTETERENLSVALATASDWLDENSETATTAEYKSQTQILRGQYEKITFRIKERRAFPKAAADLRKAIQNNKDALKNITEQRNVTEAERDAVVKQIEGAEKWLDNKQGDQYATAKNADPVITSEEVARKQSDIDFATKMLLRKPKKKVEKPKIIETEKETKETTEETEKPTTEETEEKTEQNEQNEQTEQTEQNEQTEQTEENTKEKDEL